MHRDSKRFRLGWFSLHLASVALATNLLATNAQSNTPEIRFATEGAFSPFNEFRGKELAGFEIDVANAVAQKLSMKSVWQAFPFDSLLIGLNRKKYDAVIASHAITPEREKAVDFTIPHYCTGGTIFAQENGPLTRAGLANKTVGVQVGTTYFANLKAIAGVKEIKTYLKDTDGLQNLLSGHIDAWITDRFVGKKAIQAHGSKQGKKIVMGDTVFEEKVAMAVAKGNSDLRTKLNQGIEQILKDGTYAAISQRYFSEDIRCK